MGSFPEIPPQDGASQLVDKRWDHDKAAVMADALKEGARASTANNANFDDHIAMDSYLREINPSLNRAEQKDKLVRWTDKALEPLSQIYDRDPERFATMPTKDFMELANKIISLEARERAAATRLEELKRDVATREAALYNVRAELQGLLNPDQRSTTVAENLE